MSHSFSVTMSLCSVKDEVINERKRKTEQLEWMQCNECLSTPRYSPIFSCFNGHLICIQCKPKMTKCPVCNVRKISCRSLIAEKLWAATLEDTPLACKYQGIGCIFRDLLVNLEKHEAKCTFRFVQCPGSCNWKGPLNRLCDHLTQKKCATWNSCTWGYFEDFSSDVSVLSHTTPSAWKPVIILTEEKEVLGSLFLRRDAEGYWYLYLRSFSDPRVVRGIRMKLRVGKARDAGLEAIPGKEGFLYQGRVNSKEDTDEEIDRNGCFLLLKDSQISKLMVAKALFRYTISVDQIEGFQNDFIDIQ